MKIAQPKPRLGSKFVREAFFHHIIQHKVDEEEKTRNTRIFRMMVVFKELAAIIKACLHRTKLCLLYDMVQDNWDGPFSKLFANHLGKQETMLFLALVKPKLGELVLNQSFIGSLKNDRLINYFVGIPHIVIQKTGSYKSGCPLLKKLAPHVSKFECPLEYLMDDLPPMNLETCVVEISDQHEINLDQLCSKHQIRQIRLEFQHHYKDYDILCSGQYRNSSLEELTLKNDHYCRVRLPNNLLECFPNLKRVFRSLSTQNWYNSLYNQLSASVECAREWVQKSPDLRFVFDVCVNNYRNSNRVALLRQLRGLGLLRDDESSFGTKEKLENDPDIKLCHCYEAEDNSRILVCSTGRIKIFFWYK